MKSRLRILPQEGLLWATTLIAAFYFLFWFFVIAPLWLKISALIVLPICAWTCAKVILRMQVDFHDRQPAVKLKMLRVAFVVVVVGLVAYPLSFGPACWLTDRDILPYDAVFTFHSPLLDSAFDRESAAAPLLNWWADIGARREGAARRITCKGYNAEFGGASIEGCTVDDLRPL